MKTGDGGSTMSYSIGFTNEAVCRTCGEGARGDIDAVLRWGNAHVCKVVHSALAAADERRREPS